LLCIAFLQAMEVILSDESLNMYGFRILTDGIDLSAFEKNPVMLYDHARRDYKNETDIILPIGKWTNLKKKKGQLIGEPEFDVEDEFAKKISRKFEKGYLNAASIGFPAFDAIEYSDDPDLKLPGQYGPTITKCVLREVSITDIPGNINCVKMSYQGKNITLNGKSDATELTNFFNSNNKPTESIMKKTIAVLNATKLVSLPDTATDELVEQGAQVLVSQLSAKDQVILQKDAEIKRLTDEAAAAKTNSLKEKATALVEGALSAKKIVASQKDNYIALAASSEEAFKAQKAILDGMKGYENVNEQITPAGDETEEARVTEYKKLHVEGKLEKLKASNPDRFKQLSDSFKASKK
jgi:hypothetical protein